MKYSDLGLKDKLAELMGGSASADIAAKLIMILLTAVVFWVFWKVLLRLIDRANALIAEQKGKQIRALKIQKQNILSAKDVTKILQGLVKFTGILAKVVLLLLFLNIIFGYFDWSRQAALKVIGYVGQTLADIFAGMINFLPNLIVIVVIALISRFVLHLLKLVFDGVNKGRINIPGFYPEWSGTSYSLARLMVIALTIVIVFPYLPGSGSPAFQGLSIFFGVLLSLGSSSAIANVISGIVITYTRAFKMGDRVRIAATEGEVIERSAFVTRVRTPKNVEVAIPNAMVMNDHIVNYSTQAEELGVTLHTTVTIGYDVPWPKVHELLIEAALKTDKVQSEPEPYVFQTSLDDNYVAYELNAITRDPGGKNKIYSDLHAHILDSFNAANVEILSPHYRANRDGNESTVPSSDSS